MAMEPKNPFRLATLWKEVPTIARLIIFGLGSISAFVIWQFFKFISSPGATVSGEDFVIHVGLLIMIPGVTLALLAISIAYSYYQICKRHNIKPFWKKMEG